MAFPTTGVIDVFTRADAASLGANYTANPFNNGATSLEISSNAAVGQNATFSFDLNWYNVATFGPDVEVFVTLSTLGDAASEVYLIARVQSPSASSSTGDGYWCELTGGGTTLTYKSITNGSASTLGSSETPGAFSPGDSFGFSVVGTTLQAYRKTSGVWSTYGTSRTDGTYTGAGYIGLGSYEDTRTQVIDDFGGGTVVVAGSNNTRRSLLGVGR